MENPSSFKIFSASAGSGKTFNLVMSYMVILLSTENSKSFRNILALTFTNKAVAEMKERIIKTLQDFSETHILNEPSAMILELEEILNLSRIEIHNRSKNVLKNLLHNYAAFDVSTIDKFNHRIIRTFANDLKLPPNFEVELDTAFILSKAVDHLINKAGSDKQLTKLLVDFAIDKVDDDKSWDIARDLNNIAILLISENDRPYLELIKNKNLSDFDNLKVLLKEKIKNLQTEIVKSAKLVLETLEQSGLQDSDFMRGTLPSHFKKLTALNLSGLYDNKLQENLKEGTNLYVKSQDVSKKATIDRLAPSLENDYLTIKTKVFEILFLKNALKHLVPLSVLNAIYTSLTEITLEDQLVLISDFNSLINNEIKDQPAPYIYERMGERYKHFFIDEFQDTSVLQWNNLVPLIDNALSQQYTSGQNSTAMLVGDSKQAIYRWRGGRAEQFIDLYNGASRPFMVDLHQTNLPKNYRSRKHIVEFNNAFFNFLSQRCFSNLSHGQLFKEGHQETNTEKAGLVEISFIEKSYKEKDEMYAKRCLDVIDNAVDQGFNFSDICIITRKRKESIAIATFLLEKGVPVISSESLLLKNSPEVAFMVSILKLLRKPDENEYKIQVLEYIANDLLNLNDKHKFYKAMISQSLPNIFDLLKDYGFSFNVKEALSLPLYELAESIVRAFKFNEGSHAYIQFFLDEIYGFGQKKDNSLRGFLDFFEQKMEKLSVVSPQGANAVELMTIHKSKGLEFRIVVFPYANLDIYKDLNPKMWFPVKSNEFAGFKYLYIGVNKELEDFNEMGSLLYNEYRSQLELDNINLLYVVMTRAVEQLYVISELDLTSKSETNPKKYSGLFIDFLRNINEWEEGKLTYTFGEPSMDIPIKTEQFKEIDLPLVSTDRKDVSLQILSRSGLLWDTQREAAIEKGDLIHYVFSKIQYIKDTDKVIKDTIIAGILDNSQATEISEVINNVIHHPHLRNFYTEDWTVYNERDIISITGNLHRPDRVMVNDNNEAAIIDYKTGAYKSMHKDQIIFYSHLVEEMGHKVIKKILVYINTEIEVKEL